jgi:hypothetical protein
MTPDKQHVDKDQRLLRRLLLIPTKRPTRSQRINAFFSHPAWQSAGAIIGLLSLVVTIILTIYVFNLGRDQGTAHIDGTFTPNAIPDDLRMDKIDPNTRSTQVISLRNNGPSMGEAITISIVSAYEVRCTQAMGNNFEQDKATKIISANGRCDLLFDYFYPGHIASIYVEETNDLVRRSAPSEFDVQPGEGVWWTISGKNVIVAKKTFNEEDYFKNITQ